MASFLFGLLCLCVLNVEGIKGAENDVLVTGLFSWIAGLRGNNDTIELKELRTSCRMTDYNKDGYLSGAEVRVGLKEMNLPPSSYAEIIFGSLDVNNTATMKSLFHEMDESGNRHIDQSEFQSYYNGMVGILDFIETHKRKSIKCTVTSNERQLLK